MRVLVLVLALLFPIAAAAQSDQDDRGFIQGLLEDALSGPGRSVAIEGFSGALSSQARIDKITVSDPDGIWLSATDLVMTWQRSALLSGRIAIQEISAAEVDLIRRPVPLPGELPALEAGGNFALPELPVAVQVDRLNIAEMSLGEEWLGQTADIAISGTASLQDGAGKIDLDLTRLDRIGQVEVAGSYSNETKAISIALSLVEPEGGIAASMLNIPGTPSVDLALDGGGDATNFDATLTLATDGTERVNGGFALRPVDDGATQFAIDVTGDMTALLAPEYVGTLGERLSIQGSGSFAPDAGVTLDQFILTAAAVSIDAQGRIGADGWPEKLNLEAKIIPVPSRPKGVVFPGLNGSIRALDLKGNFDAANGDAWQITGTASDAETEQYSVDALTFAGKGRISRTQAKVDGRLDLAAKGLTLADDSLALAIGSDASAGFDFDWTQSGALDFANISLDGSDYGLTGTLQVMNAGALAEMQLVPDIRLSASDLSRFAALTGQALAGSAQLEISGSLQPVTGIADLRFTGRTRDLALGIEELDPLLAGRGHVDLGVKRDASGVILGPVAIETQHATIDASATLSSNSGQFMAVAEIAEISRISGMPAGKLSADLAGKYAGNVLSLETQLDMPGLANASFAGDIVLSEKELGQASGHLRAEVNHLSAFSGIAGRDMSGSLAIEGQGSFDPASGAFEVDGTGSGAGLAFALPSVDPLLAGKSDFAVQAARDTDGNYDISRIHLSAPNLTADLNGGFDGRDGTASYVLSLPDLGVVIPELPGPGRLEGTANYATNAWTIAAAAQGPGGISLRSEGTVAPDLSSVDLSLRGSAPLALANARLRGQSLSGALDFDLNVRGAPALSSVSGRLTVADGRFAVPAQAFALENIRAEANVAQERATLSASASVADGGDVAVSGMVGMAGPFDADLTGELRNVVVRSADLYTATLSGNLALDGSLAGGAKLSGQIDVARADMRIPQFPADYTPLDGLKHVNTPDPVRRTLERAGLSAEPEKSGTYPDYLIDVSVRAPNQMFVSGRGLDAELGGTLRVSGSTRDIVPVGAFSLIRGRLDLLGRRLELTEGEASLRGSFDPQIKFAATTDVEGVQIGLAVEGLATSPQLTVTSSPELPQDEALSLFLFGHNITEISTLQAVQLASAIRTLSGRGGPGITERIRDKLGVDDLDVTTNADTGAEVKLGKYISDNVYTDVSVGSTGTSKINLNLELNKSATVRGSLGSDGETGIGVYFEKDY